MRTPPAVRVVPEPRRITAHTGTSGHSRHRRFSTRVRAGEDPPAAVQLPRSAPLFWRLTGPPCCPDATPPALFVHIRRGRCPICTMHAAKGARRKTPSNAIHRAFCGLLTGSLSHLLHPVPIPRRNLSWRVFPSDSALLNRQQCQEPARFPGFSRARSCFRGLIVCVIRSGCRTAVPCFCGQACICNASASAVNANLSIPLAATRSSTRLKSY
jgi:hypothetical protein